MAGLEEFPPIPALQQGLQPAAQPAADYADLRRGSLEDPHWTVRAEMLFSCLISSVSAGLTNTASPSLTPPINDCVYGAMDHRYMVTLKQQAASSIGRRLDTRRTGSASSTTGSTSSPSVSTTLKAPTRTAPQVRLQVSHKLDFNKLNKLATSSEA